MSQVNTFAMQAPCDFACLSGFKGPVIFTGDSIMLSGCEQRQGGPLWVSQFRDAKQTLSKPKPIVMSPQLGGAIASEQTTPTVFVIKSPQGTALKEPVRYGQNILLQSAVNGKYLQFNDTVNFEGKMFSKEGLCAPCQVEEQTANESHWQCCGAYNFVLNDLNIETLHTFLFNISPAAHSFENLHGDYVSYGDDIVLRATSKPASANNPLCGWNQQKICQENLCTGAWDCGNYFSFPTTIQSKEHGNIMIPYAGSSLEGTLRVFKALKSNNNNNNSDTTFTPTIPCENANPCHGAICPVPPCVAPNICEDGVPTCDVQVDESTGERVAQWLCGHENNDTVPWWIPVGYILAGLLLLTLVLLFIASMTRNK